MSRLRYVMDVRYFWCLTACWIAGSLEWDAVHVHRIVARSLSRF